MPQYRVEIMAGESVVSWRMLMAQLPSRRPRHTSASLSHYGARRNTGCVSRRPRAKSEPSLTFLGRHEPAASLGTSLDLHQLLSGFSDPSLRVSYGVTEGNVDAHAISLVQHPFETSEFGFSLVYTQPGLGKLQLQNFSHCFRPLRSLPLGNRHIALWFRFARPALQYERNLISPSDLCRNEHAWHELPRPMDREQRP